MAFAVEVLRIEQKAGDFADAIRARVVRSFGKVVVRVSPARLHGRRMHHKIPDDPARESLPAPADALFRIAKELI